ncbi:type IV secretory pathway TrbD component [Paraburkholderia sp. MM5482-R2]
MMADYFFGARLMTGVIIFVGVWLIALALLVRFAARIDPRSGRWRRR